MSRARRAVGKRTWYNSNMRLARDFLVFCLVFAVCGAWIFSGWPQVWHNPPIPPKVQFAYAVQSLLPTSDVVLNSWTDEGTTDNDGNLYTSLDDTTSDDDSSYILDAGANTTAEVKLSAGTDPQVSTGHVLHVLFRSSGSGGPEKLDIRLLQGATEITSQSNKNNRSASYTDLNYTLSTTETDVITDYSDLRIELTGDSVGGSEELRVTQAYLEIPDAATVSVTISDGTVAYGSLAEGATQDTFTLGGSDRQIITNDGSVTEYFNILGAATSDPDAWDLVAAAGTDEFRHRYASDDAGSVWVALTDSYQLLTESIAAGATAPLDLEIQVPTSTNATSSQTHTITVQAVQQ